MDDTLWISDFKDKLESILSIADDFYELNSILVNWDKSVLLTSIPIVSLIHFKLTHNEEWITPLDTKTSTRYLGIWIFLLSNSPFIRQQIQNEVAAATLTMRKKYITDKQLKIVFNSVLLPRILYRSQLTFFDYKFCDRIMGTYRKVFRLIMNLTKSTPPAIIHSSLVYHITHLFFAHMQAKVANFTKMINDKGLLGLTALIRSRQLQLNEWLVYSPLFSWPYDSSHKFKDWWSALLSNLKTLHITITNSQTCNNAITGGHIPLIDIYRLS